MINMSSILKLTTPSKRQNRANNFSKNVLRKNTAQAAGQNAARFCESQNLVRNKFVIASRFAESTESNEKINKKSLYKVFATFGFCQK